jgi:hypothetical protein
MNQSLIVQPACIGGSLQGAKQNKLLCIIFPYTISLRSSWDDVSTRNVNERGSRLRSNMTFLTDFRIDSKIETFILVISVVPI